MCAVRLSMSSRHSRFASLLNTVESTCCSECPPLQNVQPFVFTLPNFVYSLSHFYTDACYSEVSRAIKQVCLCYFLSLFASWYLTTTTVTTATLHPFNGLFSRTTWVSWYQKDKTSLDLNEARGWGFGMQWHQLDHMQTICTSLQKDNHTNTSSLNFYRPCALPDA